MAVETVLTTPTAVEEVRFVLFSPPVHEAFDRALGAARTLALPVDVLVVPPTAPEALPAG